MKKINQNAFSVFWDENRQTITLSLISFCEVDQIPLISRIINLARKSDKKWRKHKTITLKKKNQKKMFFQILGQKLIFFLKKNIFFQNFFPLIIIVLYFLHCLSDFSLVPSKLRSLFYFGKNKQN